MNSLQNGRIGKTYKLKEMSKFNGKSLQAVDNPELVFMVEVSLERIGVSKKKDREFIIQQMNQLVSSKSHNLTSGTSYESRSDTDNSEKFVNPE